MSPRRQRTPNPRQFPRPRVVYVAFYFPPTRASGVFRSRATANHLAAAGWDVTVITPQREFFTDYIHSFDPSLEATVRGMDNCGWAVLRRPMAADPWRLVAYNRTVPPDLGSAPPVG